MFNYTLHEILYNYLVKFTEISPFGSNVRFDIVAIKRGAKREVRIYEIKSGRHDFISDKKWKKYLPYCTQFAFVCPQQSIKVEEIPKGIGLIEVYRNCNGIIDHNYIKKCSRLQDHIPDKKYIMLLEGIVLRYIHNYAKDK